MFRFTFASLALLATCSLALAQKQYDFSTEGEDLSVPGETVEQAADQAAKALQGTRMKLSISTVGFDISTGSEAEKWLQDTAQIGGGGYFTATNTGQLSAALGAAAAGQTSATAPAPAGPADTITLTAPRSGDVIGPSIEVVGKTTPTALVVILTVVYDADTGKQIRSVPGIRSRARADGGFSFRVAAPRVSFSGGQAPPPLRYELHAYVLRADGTMGPEVVVSMVAPKP